MIARKPGRPFRGEVDTTNASAGVAFTLYDSEGNSITLTADEQIVIESYHSICATAGTQVIAQTTDIAGRRIRKGSFAANGGMAGSELEIAVRKGVTPVFIGPATGQSNAMIEGRIIKLAR